LPNGLNNVRVFVGGKDAAKHFFDRLVRAAIVARGTGLDELKQDPVYWNSQIDPHIKIYGLAQDKYNSLICSVRYDVLNRDQPSFQDPSGETWNSMENGVLAIHYREHRISHLAWIEIVFRVPGVNPGGAHPGHGGLFLTGVHSYRLIFLDRQDQPEDPIEYYGYEPTPPVQTEYPVFVSQANPQEGHALICDVKQYEDVGVGKPGAQLGAEGTFRPFQAGGGGGEM
jgi:hypothetical protein